MKDEKEVLTNTEDYPDKYVMYVTTKVIPVGAYKVDIQKTLIIDDYDFIKDIIGSYKCVVEDPGYPGQSSIYKEYNIVIQRANPSSVFTSFSLTPSSFSSSSVHSSSILSLPTNSTVNTDSTVDKTFFVTIAVSSICLIIILIVLSLVVSMVIISKNQTKKLQKIIMAGRGQGEQPTTALTKGILHPTSFMFFPKFTCGEREVPRSHLMYMDTLGMLECFETTVLSWMYSVCPDII